MEPLCPVRAVSGSRRAPREEAKSGLRRSRRPAKRWKRAFSMRLRGGLPRADRGGFLVATTAEPRWPTRSPGRWGGDHRANRKKFVGGQGAAQCRTERGSHAHDDLGQLPRPPAGTGGSYGAAQVSIGHMQAWGSKPVRVSREGARAKHAEAGGACGLGRLRPAGVLGMVRVCAPVRARRKRSGLVLAPS